MGVPLQVAAVVVRLLSQLSKKPIVAVNHCVAHIEMGRVVTGADDLVVLYVSGGNTQVIARGGIEFLQSCQERRKVYRPSLCCQRNGCFLAKKGEKLIDLPYVVKGMDVSFSGILSHLKATAEEKLKNNEWIPANLCYSL
ncbi:unnamed protein product [Camellia sinensis]